MRVVQDDLWLCVDCTLAAVNGDMTSLDYWYGDEADARAEEIIKGLEKLGPHLVPGPDEPQEFSRCCCDCCDSDLAGERHSFAILGEDE